MITYIGFDILQFPKQLGYSKIISCTTFKVYLILKYEEVYMNFLILKIASVVKKKYIAKPICCSFLFDSIFN